MNPYRDKPVLVDYRLAHPNRSLLHRLAHWLGLAPVRIMEDVDYPGLIVLTCDRCGYGRILAKQAGVSLGVGIGKQIPPWSLH